MLIFIGLSELLAGWLSRYSFSASALLTLLPPPEKTDFERDCTAFWIRDSAVDLLFLMKNSPINRIILLRIIHAD
jgi:hypothetical protein